MQDKKVESHHLLLLGSFSEGLSLESPLWDTKRGSHLVLDAHDTWKAPAQVGLADCLDVLAFSGAQVTAAIKTQPSSCPSCLCKAGCGLLLRPPAAV